MTTPAKKTAAPAKKTDPEFVENADPRENPEGWEWDTVAEGSAAVVIFEDKGDQFVGQFLGSQHIEREPNAKGEDQSFDRFLFRGRDGERYAINKSYALEEAMEDVNDGQWVRITYIKDIPTARNQNPMKDFRVDVRK